MLRPKSRQTSAAIQDSTAHQKGTTRLYSSRRVEHHPLFSLFSRSKKVGILSSSASSRESLTHWSKSMIFVTLLKQFWHLQLQIRMKIQHHKAKTCISRSPNIRHKSEFLDLKWNFGSVCTWEKWQGSFLKLHKRPSSSLQVIIPQNYPSCRSQIFWTFFG